MKKVFLGGTCNNSKWREELIKGLKINYFNPVVDDCTEDCIVEEIKQRKECDFILYTITPRMAEVYSIAEVVEDSNKRPYETLLCVLLQDGDITFSEHQIKSLGQVNRMVIMNGARVFFNLEDLREYLNQYA